MASWFKPSVSALDSVANTIRVRAPLQSFSCLLTAMFNQFQQAAMAAEARYYKSRCAQFHKMLQQFQERNKEFKELQQ